MTTALKPTTWHTDVVINGQPYPTRHPAPLTAANSGTYLDDLTDEQRDHLRAIHEAAHAVAGLATGAHVHYAKISRTVTLKAAAPSTVGIPGGDTYTCNIPDGHAFALYLGAGERAEDKWLRESGLWTELRATGVELGAYGDRRAFLNVNPHIRFGIDHNDYLVVHDLADQLVTQQWHAITSVAAALSVRMHLTGIQIADLAQLPNGTHSPTCAGRPTA